MILTQFYLLFALFIGLCSCLSRSNYAQHLFRKRSSGSSRSLPIEDQKSIQAASLFFSNDKVTLGQAMEKYKVTDKSASSSSASQSMPSPSSHVSTTKSHDSTTTELRPFSKDVLRRNAYKRPPLYDSNKQFIARHAQVLIKKDGVKEDDAIGLAKARLDERKKTKQNNAAYWRHLANTDPSLARQMKTKVPTRLAQAHYIPLRAHQLDHLGKANGMVEATNMARAEVQQFTAQKAANHQKRKDRRKQAAAAKR